MRSLVVETLGTSETDLSFSTYRSELHHSSRFHNNTFINTHLSGAKAESKRRMENGMQRNAARIDVDLASALPDIADDEPTEAHKNQNLTLECY